MAHLELAPLQQCAHVAVERQQSQQVRHRRARAPHPPGQLLMRHAELVDQTLQRPRLLQWIEVLTLYVLDQRNYDCRLVRDLAHHRRHSIQPGQLCRPPAALARDNLIVAALQLAHDDGLHHALGPNRIRQLGQGLFVHMGARLILAALKQIDGDVAQCLRIGQRFHRRLQQGIQTPTQTRFLAAHDIAPITPPRLVSTSRPRAPDRPAPP